MRNRLILFATAASLLLGGCGSNVEESADTPISAVEESGDTPVSAVEESAATSILVAKLAERIRGDSPPFILDARKREEYARGHIPGALNIPYRELPTRLAELPIRKSEEVVVYDQGGRGSAYHAEETLRGSGYSNVRDLTGHFNKWQAAGLPIE
jgi:rhodanese-related sulfurtransferase